MVYEKEKKKRRAKKTSFILAFLTTYFGTNQTRSEALFFFKKYIYI
jgi:hypothetical protein